MLRAYQLTMARGLSDHHNNNNNSTSGHHSHNGSNHTSNSNNHHHHHNHRHSGGPWSLKDRSDINATSFSAARGKAVSTHILGVGIIFVGVLVLAVGLIMGLEFPRYVYQQNKDDQCVVHEGHRKYPEWVDGTQWTRLVRIYYWTLVNPDGFMYRSEIPKFEQRGPYVYTEREYKYDVTFDGPHVSYRLRRRFVFDAATTQLECQACKEDDTLTILSPWYLRAVGSSGGEELLAWSSVSLYTSGLLQQAAGGAGDSPPWTLNDTLASALGDFRSSPSTSLLTKSHPEMASSAFGPWLYNQTGAVYWDTLQDPAVRENPFSPAEMTALYGVLSNASSLGGLALTLHDSGLRDRCRTWAEDICGGGERNSAARRRAGLDLSLAACGVIYLLHSCSENVSSRARELLHQAFCPLGTASDSCLDFQTVTQTLVNSYAHALSDYLAFLSNHFLNVFLAHKQLGLVERRPQTQLALGFEAPAAVSFVPKTFYSGLLFSDWGEEGGESEPLWRVYTCLQNRDMDNNMKLTEYNNNWFSPVELESSSETKSSLASHTDFGPACGSLRTCTDCSSPDPWLKFFLESLQRPAVFDFLTHVSLWGVDVFKYEMSSDALGNSSRLRVSQGLQNMSGVTGFLAWVGEPHVTGQPADHVSFVEDSSNASPSSSSSSSSSSQSSADVDQHVEPSYISVEPVTGRVWQRSIKLQRNVGVMEESAHALERNIRDPGLPFPVFWTDHWTEVSGNEVDGYKHLVTRLMRVSCGGVIGFSIVAVIVMIIGVVVCVYPSKPNRVTPASEETPASHAASRH